MSILSLILREDFSNLFIEVNEKLDELAAVSIEYIREEIEDEVIAEARFKIVNRVRGGKIQRRRKVSQVKGYRMQDGRLVRMSSQEKLHRKVAQRRGAIKRKSKVATALRKRKISIKRRGAL